MSRQISKKRSDQYLKRQHSMKIDDNYGIDIKYLEPYNIRSNSVQRLRTNPSVPYELHSNIDQSTKRYPRQMNTNLTGKSISPHLLNVINPSPSVHSSLVAMSRVSQQPSFESYDSSMSTTSWTSSNDPDIFANTSRYSNDPRSISPNYLNSYNTSLSTSPQSKDRNIQMEYNPTMNDIRNNNNNKQENIKTDLKLNNEVKVNTKSTKVKDAFQSRKKNPLLRSMTVDNNSSLSTNADTTECLSSSSSTFQLKTSQTRSQSSKRLYSDDEKCSNDLSKRVADLKIIGMKKEGSGDLKSTASSVPQNIRGLWKRAFQSLRKDKNDKDQIKRKENGSQPTEPQTPEGEIDPVYHLLRCAASKSQSTALATTGLINAKTNPKTKSSMPDTSITKSQITKKSENRLDRSTSLKNPSHPFY
ncbi:unnamed protein product [Heterobilharzia americana]|nr:unnamed protein product [Heterobilharzia americana]